MTKGYGICVDGSYGMNNDDTNQPVIGSRGMLSSTRVSPKEPRETVQITGIQAIDRTLIGTSNQAT